jgi:anti-sigma regulatory factor (Ser/Thr protein kinase)
MERRSIILNNKTEELERLMVFIEEIGNAWSLKADKVFELNLILEEYITNLVNYGYHDMENHEIIIGILKEENQLKITVTDDAGPFNILETPDNEEIDKPVDERRIGGLGIHFIRTLADEIVYTSEGGLNKLTFLLQFSSRSND